MQRRHFSLALAAGAVAPTAFAQPAPYPSKTIRIISPFATGGIADSFSRLIGIHLQKAWGQPVIVENRLGAGGNIGADVVAKAAPDGYTLVMGNNGTHAVNISLFPSMPFDPVRDFTPIVRVIEAEGVLVVNPTVNATTVQELIALARANPGQLAYASGGIGTTSHLAAELFKSLAKIELTHIPYKGNTESVFSVLAGNAQLTFATMPTALPFLKDNRLRALGVLENQRSKALPSVPTIAESGVPNFDVKNWIGLFGPANLPTPIVTKINTEVIRIMKLPEVQPQLEAAGARFAPNTPADFEQYARADMRLWAKIIKDANIRV